MAKLQFKYYNQSQGELFPSYLGEKIPKTHHVLLLSGIVDALDITDLMSTYNSFGCPAYHPRMLLKVVFYAYMNNIYSCRKIEDALKYHIHYMWLSGSQTPSFSTINRFRSEHLKDTVNKLFSQVVSLLAVQGTGQRPAEKPRLARSLRKMGRTLTEVTPQSWTQHLLFICEEEH